MADITECAWCGTELDLSTNRPATKAWCSSECRQKDKAQEKRRETDRFKDWNQAGIESFE